MSLILSSETRGDRRQVLLLAGQVAVIGSSPWGDLYVPDKSLADSHFRVELGDAPVIQAIDECELLVESQRVKTLSCRPHVSFQAGESSFSIEATPSFGCEPSIGEQVADGSSVGGSGSKTRTGVPIPGSQAWPPKILAELNLNEQARDQVANAGGPSEATSALLSSGQALDALKVWLASLPVEAAIRQVWGKLQATAESSVSGKEVVQLTDVRAWCQSPNEESRERVGGHVTDSPSTPLQWVCRAIDWTGGSLADDRSPIVPPPEQLPVLAASSAVQLHCVLVAESLQNVVAAFAGVRVSQSSKTGQPQES